MQPEQPINTPSTDVQASDAAAAEPRSEEQQEGSSQGWFSRLFHRGGGPQETATEAQDATEASSASKPLSLTQEELDRRVQAETDRREAKRASEARAAAKKKLRDEDPFAYAQLEREEEEVGSASNQIGSFVTGIATHHDQATIDPLVGTLPEAERQRILAMQGAGYGLEGRKLLVTESLKALEKHWKAEGAKEAETRLRRNSAFRKQVLSEFRGQTPEPELLPSTASASDADVSQILRSAYGFRS